MIILIKIENKAVSLILKDKKNVLDSFKFAEERRLSERLLPEIDKLLKKNKLEARDIEKIRVESDLGENFTTCRIAKAVARAWNYGIGCAPH